MAYVPPKSRNMDNYYEERLSILQDVLDQFSVQLRNMHDNPDVVVAFPQVFAMANETAQRFVDEVKDYIRGLEKGA